MRLRVALTEALRVLKPGGKILIITEKSNMNGEGRRMTRDFPYIKYTWKQIDTMLHKVGYVESTAKELDAWITFLYLIEAKKPAVQTDAAMTNGGIDLRSKRYKIIVENDGQDFNRDFSLLGIRNLKFDGVEFRINRIERILNPQEFLQE